MDFTDNYTHKNVQVLYFSKNLPTKEMERQIRSSNMYCDCEESTPCNENPNCNCAKGSGTQYRFDNIHDLQSYQISCTNFKRPTYECNEQCACVNRLCGNKLVQCGPRSDLTVHLCDNPIKGDGLFTDKAIEKHKFVCEYAGELISEKEASMRYKINAQQKRMNYIFCIDEFFGDRNVKTFIDPTFYGNIGRYINHSCEPNCFMVITRISSNLPVLAIYTQRDIKAGEELCYDYGIVDRSDVLDENGQKLDRTKCLCDSENCRGFLPYDTRIM